MLPSIQQTNAIRRIKRSVRLKPLFSPSED